MRDICILLSLCILQPEKRKMKKLIIAFLLLVACPTFLWADAWDNLTFEQAEEVQNYINANPYILDYCDCCDYEGEYATKVYLMKVISSEIVACEWDPSYYNVKTKVEVVAEIPYKSNGPDMASPVIRKSEEDLTLTMNYTWGYNPTTRKAAPLYCMIPYDVYGEQDLDSGSCREFTAFPNPEHIRDTAYSTWYKTRF